MSPHPSPLPASLTAEEIEQAVSEVRQLLNAAKARGDVDLMDYNSEYLKTSKWKRTIKPRILKRDGKICRSCGGFGDVVHHRSYDRDVLEGANDEMLVTVCRWCHDIIHFDEDGAKRPFEETDAVLFAPKATAIPEPKVDMRKLSSFGEPPSKPRMTGYQRKLWHDRALEIRREKRAQLDEAKRIRDAAKPPVEPPSMSWAEQRAYRMK